MPPLFIFAEALRRRFDAAACYDAALIDAIRLLCLLATALYGGAIAAMLSVTLR